MMESITIVAKLNLNQISYLQQKKPCKVPKLEWLRRNCLQMGSCSVYNLRHQIHHANLVAAISSKGLVEGDSKKERFTVHFCFLIFTG
jgi:hypothetical protein